MMDNELLKKAKDLLRANIENIAVNAERPKNGYELLAFLKENKKCEIVDTHAFIAAKALEDNNCGFCFSFKKSKWNKGWSGFERL